MLGSFWAGGAGKYPLNGALDEVKLFQFPVTTFGPAAFSFLLQEEGLAFRNAVLDDLKSHAIILSNGDDRFKSPTLDATSLLRAWVNSFFTRDRACLALGFYDKTLRSVYPLNGAVTSNAPISRVGGACNSGCGTCTTPPHSGAYNSIYLNLRDGEITGYCGIAAATLWAVYEAFGYPARIYDWINNFDIRYTDSHSITEVFVTDANTFVMQDPTYNVSGFQNSLSGVCNGSNYCGVMDLSVFGRQSLSSLPFSDGGYQYNLNPKWATPTPSFYFSYFKTIVAVTQAYRFD
jgi:hypothetical protein